MAYALITGASKGIGKAIAYQLAAKGINLLLVARSESLLQQLAADITQKHKVDVHFLCADFTKKEAAQNILDWCSAKKFSVHILVNNAGFGLTTIFEEAPLQEYLDMMQVNMNAVVELTYLFIPQLKQQPKSYILNISSSSAYQAVPYLTVYAATKSFVLSFSRGLRYELRKSSVSVTCVSPGSTNTDFNTTAKMGDKAMKTAEKVIMKPEAVASLAVKAMFDRRAELITGFINKLGAFFVWLLPKKLVESTAAKIYQ